MPQPGHTTEDRPIVALTVKWEHYADWVVQNGGEVRLLTPERDCSLDGAAGLLLTGGEDVDPALYGEVNRSARRVNAERDKFELRVLETALKQSLPVLAICRGMQLLAVSLGGTLYQDLSERPSDTSTATIVSHRGPGGTDTDHSVQIELSSNLAPCVGTSTLTVNSHHHQGIKSLPSSLRVSARSQDGLPEAIEHVAQGWIRGLQWHPERWPHESSKAIAEGFLAACGKS